MKFILIALSLTPILWFLGKGGQILDGVDTNFPLNPLVWFGRRLFVWTNIPNGGSDFSASTAGFFFHFIQVFFFELSHNLQVTQIGSLIFWFAAIVFSSYFFAKTTLTKNKIAQFLFVIFYTFNTYIFNTWENVKVANLSLYVAMPLGLALVNQWLTQQRITKKLTLLTFLCGVFISGGGINPAYFLVFVFSISVTILFSYLAQRKNIFIKRAFLFFSIIALANAFWIIPSAFFIFSSLNGSQGLEQIGYTNWIDSLSANTSLFNVFRLQGAWDWYTTIPGTLTPLYIPYAHNYFYRLPFVAFSILLPLLAFISLGFQKKGLRFWYFVFALFIIVGVFLGVGTHEPTGSLYRVLMKLPFLSFFRSPWYIFTPLVTIGYAGLIALLFDYLFTKLKSTKRNILTVLALSFAAANLVYCYPLVTGKIFRPEKNDSFYVNFPDYVFQSQEWLEENNSGRMLNYPQDELEEFSWGYRGIESLVALLADQEMIFLPMSNTQPNITAIIRNLYSAIAKEQYTKSAAIAQKLNITKIFEKRDQASFHQRLPEVFRKNLLASFGEWNFYQFPGQAENKIYTSNQIYSVYPSNNTANVVGMLSQDSITIASQDSVVNSFTNSENLGTIITTEEAQLVKENNKYYLSYKLSLPTEGQFTPVLENYHFESITNDSRQIDLVLDKTTLTLEIEQSNDSFFYLEQVFLAAGEHSLKVPLTDSSILKSLDFEEMVDIKNLQKGDANFEVEKEENSNHYLRIYNASDLPAYVTLPIEKFNPHRDYQIYFRYRQHDGSLPQVLGTQWDDRGVFAFQENTLSKTNEWKNHNLKFAAATVGGKMKFELVSYESEVDNGSTTDFDDIEVIEYTPLKLSFVKSIDSDSLPQLTTKYISPVEYHITVNNSSNSYALVFSENYSPYWTAEVFTEDGKKIQYNNNHFMANGYANAWFIPNAPENYTVRLYYWPQNLYIFGWLLSGLTAGFLIFKKS